MAKHAIRQYPFDNPALVTHVFDHVRLERVDCANIS